MDALLLRFTLRSLRKNPGFTAVAVLTLALGIGANTAIFSVVRSAVLSSLPYPEADRIVRVWPEKQVSTEYLLVFEEETRSFEALSGYGYATVSLTGGGRPEELSAIEVSPRHFEVMGVQPFLGRAFAPGERRPGQDDVAILSYGLWQRRLGGDPRSVGRTLTLNGREKTVVGVLPEGFRPLREGCEVWLPLTVDPASEKYANWFFEFMIARLAPGVSRDQALADVRRVVARLRERDADMIGAADVETATVTPLLDEVVGDFRRTAWILFGAVGLVLLIACANVGNLLLARSSARRREIAVRSALGAGRKQILGQLLTESAVLSLGGALLGLLTASWTVSFLAGRWASSLPRVREIAVDGPVLAFALGASLVAGLLFGLVPALRASRADFRSALKSGGRGTTERHRLNHVLVTAEIALSVVLVIGAGLLVKSFWLVQRVEPGFVPENLLTFKVKPPPARYDDDEKRRIYFEAVREEIAAVPGVASAGAVNLLPMTRGTVSIPYLTEDQSVPTDEPPPSTTVRIVTPELLDTLSVPLARGRRLEATDRRDAPPVGLVNQTMAKQVWGDEDPVGRRVLHDDGTLWFTVVGVMGDIRQHRLDRPTMPQAYLPLGQQSWYSSTYFLVRAASGPLKLAPALKRAVWSVDDDVPITQMALMKDVIRRSMTDQRQLTGLFALFAALALVLGAVGVYGVTAYTVSQRTHETGVRIALGATGAAVVRGSLKRVMVPVALGLGLGLAASWGVTRLLASLLYQVRATDPAVFTGVAIFLSVAAGLAGYLPSRRAARVDPMVVLGTD